MNANVDGMNKPSPTSGSNTPSANDSDQDFDPSAEMLINDFDDEHTLEEEEANDDCSNITSEISDLKKEGEMPIEELLALYGYQQSGNKADKSCQEASQRTSTNNAENDNVKESNCSSAEDTTANASQDSQVNQQPSSNSAGTYTTSTSSTTTTTTTTTFSTTRSSKQLEELSSQWSLPSTGGPLTNTSLLIDQECSDIEDDDEEDDSDGDDDDEGDDEEGEGDWRRTIQVGSDYQAVIPDGLNGYGNVPPYENEDKLLWDAYVLTEDIVVNFLRQISSFDTTENSDSLNSPSGGNNKNNDPTSAPSNTLVAQSTPLRETTNLPMTNSIRDDEVALYLLHQCGHNVEEALRRKRMQQNNPFETMSPWSEEECINFEDGIRVYGKDFHQIQKNKVSTRSVGELVQFYYLWKKTERHDMYASKWRVEKKKYSLHPGTTDYMDRFIDEQENLALQAHSMVMSTSNYTRHQSHGSYSMIHYNHSSCGVVSGGGQQSSNSTVPTPTKETVTSDNVIDSSGTHQSNGNTNNSGVNPIKSNNCGTSTTIPVTASTTTSSSSIPSSSSSSSITTNNLTTSSSPNNNGPETLNNNVGVSGTSNESLNNGLTRENVQNNPSNSKPSKTTSASDLFSPSITKMRMNIVDG